MRDYWKSRLSRISQSESECLSPGKKMIIKRVIFRPLPFGRWPPVNAPKSTWHSCSTWTPGCYGPQSGYPWFLSSHPPCQNIATSEQPFSWPHWSSSNGIIGIGANSKMHPGDHFCTPYWCHGCGPPALKFTATTARRPWPHKSKWRPTRRWAGNSDASVDFLGGSSVGIGAIWRIPNYGRIFWIPLSSTFTFGKFFTCPRKIREMKMVV